MNKLDQLKTMTTVVADTGDITSIERYRPTDATTNPTLLLKAAKLPQYQDALGRAILSAKNSNCNDADFLSHCTEKFTIDIGKQISSLIPGRVSTEVDARLSFDKTAMIAKAEHLIALYAAEGIASDRILIKLAATWEGIAAAAELEKQGIQCNLTLLFCFAQAAACADAGVTLISPFVGRIYDWYQTRATEAILPAKDPGVKSVQEIYRYYKTHNYATIVMGASFRTTGQIEALAGCDKLTISPELLEALDKDEGQLSRSLLPDDRSSSISKSDWPESQFRLGLNADAMATEKLADGIRGFSAHQLELEALFAAAAS